MKKYVKKVKLIFIFEKRENKKRPSKTVFRINAKDNYLAVFFLRTKMNATMEARVKALTTIITIETLLLV